MVLPAPLMQRITIGSVIALSLAGLTAALVACAEAAPADLGEVTQKAEPTEPEHKVTVPTPPAPAPPGTTPPVQDAAPPPPPPPPPFVPEVCDTNDQSYATKALIAQLAGTITPCPCAEGECCVEQDVGFGLINRVGCVEK
jgi:hypothetical protein